jgi:glutamate 5-kinase
MRFLEANARRVVIKIGTNSLAGPQGRLLDGRMAELSAQVAALRKAGFEVVIISSGAIGLGVGRIGLQQRPADLAGLQACAAIGQPCLMQAWQVALRQNGITAAQVLLTREDIRGRRRHLAARDTLEKLLGYGAVPVVNENDTVSADEIRFGDNDVLSALVASLLKADLLVLLSTIPGLMEDQGRGKLIPVVDAITDEITAMAGGALNVNSTGGMVTKLDAARLATQSGCGAFIGSAAEPDILGRILRGDAPGTFFVPQAISLAARKRWIAFFEKPLGSLAIDAGAVDAILQRNSSLLAKGVTTASGQFPEGAVVNLCAPGGAVVARGIARFDSATIQAIRGLDSAEIRKLQPGRSRFEVVHRDSLVRV